jgi:hypothetical protein
MRNKISQRISAVPARLPMTLPTMRGVPIVGSSVPEELLLAAAVSDGSGAPLAGSSEFSPPKKGSSVEVAEAVQVVCEIVEDAVIVEVELEDDRVDEVADEADDDLEELVEDEERVDDAVPFACKYQVIKSQFWCTHWSR